MSAFPAVFIISLQKAALLETSYFEDRDEEIAKAIFEERNSKDELRSRPVPDEIMKVAKKLHWSRLKFPC